MPNKTNIAKNFEYLLAAWVYNIVNSSGDTCFQNEVIHEKPLLFPIIDVAEILFRNMILITMESASFSSSKYDPK
jgi:hypothetical protein